MKNTTKLLALLATLGLTQSAHASVIAIIDSGTDLNHKELVNKKWTNPKDIDDAVDNDDNTYIDDVNGWNFAENNNKLIDRQYLGTFSADVYTFFEVQTRLLQGVGTAADRAWIAAARQNQSLLAELGTFGNFVHGTHVAGLAAKDNNNAQIMVMKIIPTKSPLGGHAALIKGNKGGSEQLIKMGLKLLAAQQGKGLAPMGAYVASEKARVANCSFGTSTTAVKGLIAPLIKAALRRDPTEDEIVMYSSFFVGEIVKQAGALVDPSKGKTMFVIAAGNDGTDNDVLPTSPANYKTVNTISVAATYDYKQIASFSNYGATKVEVAAPGVGILSTIPGDQYLTVSGTSQASPFVANIVGLMVDENPSLSNSDIKRILMETSDPKAFLTGKVTSGGIVNLSRSVTAAKMAKSMQLASAIQTARAQINDVVSTAKFFNTLQEDNQEEGFVIPLPSLFQ